MSHQPLAVDLSGRVALVTGANSGMGKETARELARMGAEVVLGCRSTERGEAAREDIIDSTGATAVTVMQVDVSSLASVRAFAAAFHRRFPKLDVLVNNAAASLRVREVTPEGVERCWATNVLGPHLLTTRLIPALRASGNARIVNVSTRAAGGLDLSDTQYLRRRYSGIGAYRASKQASRMLTWALADELEDRAVTANAVNPGYVLTPLTNNVTGLLKLIVVLTSFKAEPPVDGADTTLWAAASPELDGVTSKFFDKRREVRCRFREPSRIQALRAVIGRQLEDPVPYGSGERSERDSHEDVSDPAAAPSLLGPGDRQDDERPQGTGR
jgi:NAD(P)-dependent dehydrogenase (short-subunit alcohol dehydrogenase family)